MGRSFVELPTYELIKRIGTGAGAVIYSARHRTSRDEVAIKHVVRRGPDDDKFIAQAEIEHEIAHGLNHPALRRYLEMVRIRRWLKTRELFLIMELIHGETLENRFKELEPPTEFVEIVRIFRQVADGLHAVHLAGFVHADIKPNNIMMSRGAVKIIDFGQSCRLGHRKERVQGTPDFIAPEQVQRHPLDQRTDVFNLGATMYWAVTRKWLRTMLNTGTMATKKIEVDARSGTDPPEQINPAVPIPLARLITECCQQRASDRPNDMKQVGSRLELIEHLLKKKQGEAAESA